MTSGTLSHYVDDLSVSGLTSNPSIFDLAIKDSTFYDDAISRKTDEGKSGETLFFELAIEDLTRAADLFRSIHDATAGSRWRQPILPLLNTVCLSGDVHAAAAIELFCYQAKKWIGSFAAALGGLDTLVFSAGIGENAPLIRARICDGLGFLGIEMNHGRNLKNAPLISPARSRVRVRVIRTNEELMIAKYVTRILNL